MLKIINNLLGTNDPLTPEQNSCWQNIEKTNNNLLIIGKAGTGKSTLINHVRSRTKKKIVVLAPTGIAALNVRGQTIHSFFKFPPRIITEESVEKIRPEQKYSHIDTIIIDEISMVRVDIMDGIEMFLRKHGKDKNLPFGGIQMVLIGDFYQLPPVVTYEEKEHFNQYRTYYCFSAPRLKDLPIYKFELTRVLRQKDAKFINLLHKIREGKITIQDLEPINAKVTNTKISEDYIILCGTNNAANELNQTRLESIKQPEYTYEANIEGDFPTEDKILPVPLDLLLKKGARVLMVKNDKDRQWVNGSLGSIYDLGKDFIKVKLENGNIVEVQPDQWENIKYEIDKKTGKLTEKVKGKLIQYPIKLAWAITIHKSQGMSFDKICLNLGRSFAHGQTYVALSRCRTLEGLILTSKIWPSDIITDKIVDELHVYLNQLQEPSAFV